MYKVNRGCVDIEFIVVGPIQNNVYFISDGASLIVVDPGDELEAIKRALGSRVPDAIVLTHYHYDHVGQVAALRELTGAQVIASAVDAPLIDGRSAGPAGHPEVPRCPIDAEVSDGDVVQIGNMAWKALLTPGHTPGSMCLYLDPSFGLRKDGEPVLISGDTLFRGSIGRTDFADGSMADMRASLRKLAFLPDETVVLPGHNDPTLIGAERERVFARFAS